jgi:GDP-L-fucose synthase
MKVLVLGSNGLVGKHLQEIVSSDIINEWIFVSRSDADLTDWFQVKHLFEKHNPSHVINLAAFVGGLYKNMSQGVEFFEKNSLINMNVMKASTKTKKLVSIMSTCIFPDNISYPITEKDLHLGPPHSSNEGYSYAKRMIDVLGRAYNKEYGTNYVSVIPGNLYGQHDNFNLEDSHVIPALIHKMKIAQTSENPMIVFGTGKALRQFTHASDLAKCLVWVVSNYEDTEPLIISSEEECAIHDIVEYIRDELQFTGEILYDTDKSDGQLRKTISSEKWNKLCQDIPFRSLKDGLKETIQWFLHSYDVCRK